MSDVLQRYSKGETVTSIEWTSSDEAIDDAWILHDDWQNERAVAQGRLFDNEVEYRKLPKYITLTAEEEHLLRPSEAKSHLPSAPRFISSPDYPGLSDQDKLTIVRHQLRMEMEK